MNSLVTTKAYPLPLRSKFYTWLLDNPQRVATAQQWLGMLNNLQSVRKDEIERSGILGLLTNYYQPDDRVVLDNLMGDIGEELQQCTPTIDAHWKFGFHPTLAVKTMTDQLPKRVEAKAKRFVEKAQACYQHPSIGYWIIRTGYEDLATVAPNWIVLDNKGKMLLSHERHHGWFPTALEAFDVMHRTIRERFHKYGSEQPDTAFEVYSLLGGKNYQEWFVCLPDWPLPYRDGHFQRDQLLIHIRTTERIDCDGQPLFMIEEIQSPWHADGRINGYTTNEEEIGLDDCVADVPFAKEWHELGVKAVLCLAIKQGFTHIGVSTGQQQCDRWGVLDGLLNLYDQQIPKCLKKIASQFDCTFGRTTIVTRKPSARVQFSREAGWEVRDFNNKPITPSVQMKEIALFYLEHKSPLIDEQVNVLNISPALKQAVLAGELPLFGW